ncbi:MAG: hypothetical protein MJZ16_14490, partial [Bacteroidales bacterium]|nr:hypothetical protein [Bacteroidales bacterium]
TDIPVDNPSTVPIESSEEQPETSPAPVVKESFSDFYAEVNADWIAAHPLEDYELKTSNFRETDSEITNTLIAFLENTDPATLSEDSPHYKLITLYHQSLEALEDEENSMARIKSYTDAFQNASSVKEFSKLFYDKTNFRSNSLFYLRYEANTRGYYIPTLYAYPLMERFCGFTEEEKEIFIKHTSKQLMMLGYSEKDATRMAENTMKVNDMVFKSYEKDDGYYYYITAETLKEEPCSIDLVDILTSFGFDVPKNLYMSGEDGFWCNNGYLDLLNDLCSKENFQALKDYSTVEMMSYLAVFASRELNQEGNVMVAEFCGLSEEDARKEPLSDTWKQTAALNICLGVDNGNLSQYYADNFISQEDYDKLTDYLGRIQSAFSEIVDEADWLTPRLRERLKVKVKTIKLIWGSFPEYNTFEGVKLADNAIDSCLALSNSNMDFRRDHVLGQQFVNPEFFDLNVTNACYLADTNSIAICNGMFVSTNARFSESFDEWMSCFGNTLAHEVGHAFQSNNIDRMSNGLYEDTFFDEEQKAHYWSYYEDIYEKYRGILTSYGNRINAGRCSHEIFADLFGTKVCLRILSHEDNPDYDTFFKTFARDYASVSRPGVESYITRNDNHLPDHERVNAILSQFPEFYETYDINTYGISYVPEDQRIDL